jgi:hypothetical protein
MISHVTATAMSHPLCLAPLLFADAFESGDTSAWSSMVP